MRSKPGSGSPLPFVDWTGVSRAIGRAGTLGVLRLNPTISRQSKPRCCLRRSCPRVRCSGRLGPSWSDRHGGQSDYGILAQSGRSFPRHIACGACGLDRPFVVLFEQDCYDERTMASSPERCRRPRPRDAPQARGDIDAVAHQVAVAEWVQSTLSAPSRLVL
jgi:hypothetical protein